MDSIINFINFINEILWGYVLIYGLLAVGLFFTIRLGFVQFVHFPEMFRSVLGSKQNDEAGKTQDSGIKGHVPISLFEAELADTQSVHRKFFVEWFTGAAADLVEEVFLESDLGQVGEI